MPWYRNPIDFISSINIYLGTCEYLYLETASVLVELLLEVDLHSRELGHVTPGAGGVHHSALDLERRGRHILDTQQTGTGTGHAANRHWFRTRSKQALVQDT